MNEPRVNVPSAEEVARKILTLEGHVPSRYALLRARGIILDYRECLLMDIKADTNRLKAGL